MKRIMTQFVYLFKMVSKIFLRKKTRREIWCRDFDGTIHIRGNVIVHGSITVGETVSQNTKTSKGID